MIYFQEHFNFGFSSSRITHRGGGGATGSVEYPQYQETAHQGMLGNWSTLNRTAAQVLNTSWSSNPYQNISYSNPQSLINANEGQFTSLKAFLDSLDEEDDWANFLAKAVEEIDTVGVLQGIDLDPIALAARAGASDVVSDLDALITFDPVDLTDISDDSRQSASLVRDAVVGVYIDWESAVDDALSELSNAVTDVDVSGTISNYFSEIALGDLLDMIENRLGQLLSTILEEALNAVDNDLLTEIVDNFVAQRENERARQRTRYKATSSFQGASRSSAYALGLALLESDFSKEVSNFQSQANLELYGQGIQTYNQILQSYVSTGIQAKLSDQQLPFSFASTSAITDKQAKDQFVLNSVREQLQFDIGKNSQGAGVYVEAFRSELSGRIQAALSDKQAKDQGVLAKVEAFTRSFERELIARLEAATTEKRSRDSMLMQGINDMLQLKTFIGELERTTHEAIVEMNRVGYVMDSEFTKFSADLEYAHRRWALEVLQEAGVALGALSGGTFVPNSPSTASSAIGGAMSGAAIGTMIAPGVGTAIGAGLGALSGLL